MRVSSRPTASWRWPPWSGPPPWPARPGESGSGFSRLSYATVVSTLVLGVVGFLVVVPVVILFLNSFQVGQFGTQTQFGFENWTTALSNPRIADALKNTFTLALTRQGIALVIGLLIAWLLARTDLPGRNWLEFGFWVAVFLPSLTVTLGWIMVIDNFNGLANQAWRAIFGVDGPFNIFSWWGIIWAHLMTGTLAIKMMLLTPAFRNMDATLEELLAPLVRARWARCFGLSYPWSRPPFWWCSCSAPSARSRRSRSS